MKKTPLHHIHHVQSCGFTIHQGWDVPTCYTNREDEVNAVRNAVGVIDLSYRATLCLSGPDRVNFLHRILSNDIKRRPLGTGCQAALLTPQGKIVSLLRVLVDEDVIWIETEPAALGGLIEKLEMYKLSQKVHLQDLSQEHVKILVQGPNAAGLLQTLIHHELPVDEEFQHRQFTLGPDAVRVICAPETGEAGFEMTGSSMVAARIWERLFDVGSAFGLQPIGYDAFNTLRVEAGIPWFGADVGQENFPQEALLDGVLDWTKGCYVGQEPMARIKFRGHVNKKLTGIRFTPDSDPRPGDSLIKCDRQIGHLTSVVNSIHLNCPIALGYVRREYLEAGTELTADTAEGPTGGVVTTLPFYPSSDIAA